MKMPTVEFATCDTCGVQTLCKHLGEDEHICGSCESAPARAAEWDKLQRDLASSVRLLKLVSADPHRAWQVVEEIDQTLKQIEGLENANQIPSAD